jgi:hypothetical protein
MAFVNNIRVKRMAGKLSVVSSSQNDVNVGDTLVCVNSKLIQDSSEGRTLLAKMERTKHPLQVTFEYNRPTMKRTMCYDSKGQPRKRFTTINCSTMVDQQRERVRKRIEETLHQRIQEVRKEGKNTGLLPSNVSGISARIENDLFKHVFTSIEEHVDFSTLKRRVMQLFEMRKAAIISSKFEKEKEFELNEVAQSLLSLRRSVV